MSQTLRPPTGHAQPARPAARGRVLGAVLALVHAHDCESAIVETIAMLRAQSSPPDRIVVVADRCTDRTVMFARSCGAEVVETIANGGGRAGALNQALRGLIRLHREELAFATENGGPLERAEDVVVLIEPGRVLERTWLAASVERFTDPGLGALVDESRTLVVAPLPVLAQVAASRSVRVLPDRGGAGGVLDPRSPAPAYELELALEHLGWRVAPLQPGAGRTHDLPRPAPAEVRAVMHARLDYGWTAVTRRHWWLEGRGVAVLAVLATGLAATATGWAPLVVAPVGLALAGLAQLVAVARRGVGPLALPGAVAGETARTLAAHATWSRAFAGAMVRAWREW